MTNFAKALTATIAAILLTTAGVAQSDIFQPERSHATPEMQAQFPDLF